MNRLAVANDRITQIFGDEQSYTVQTEESIGQVFLKPTLENGEKPLSLTVITENGTVQDMTLVPTERDAATIILTGQGGIKSTSGEEVGRSGSPYTHPSFQNAAYEQRPSLKNQLVNAMKTLTSGQLPEMELDANSFKTAEVAGFDVNYKAAHQVGAFVGFVYEVRNEMTTPIEIDERRFYSSGDLALTFEKRVLKPLETTNLYILVAHDKTPH
jgi:type-F conjugative transfer system secretin TraK